MIAPIRRIDFDDYTELIPAFAIIALMSFTYDIGVGIAAGFVLHPWFKFAAGRGGEVRAGLWVLNVLSTLLFVFYPYCPLHRRPHYLSSPVGQKKTAGREAAGGSC